MKKENKVFYKKLLFLVVPIGLQNLMSAMVSASDAIMLSLLDQDSLSAVSLAAQVQFVLSLFWAALTIGATILAAQYWGKKDIQAVEWILAIVLKFSVLVSFVFFAGAIAFPRMLMRIFTNDDTLITLGGCLSQDSKLVLSVCRCLADLSVYYEKQRQDGKKYCFRFRIHGDEYFTECDLYFRASWRSEDGYQGGCCCHGSGKRNRADSCPCRMCKERCGPYTPEISEKLQSRVVKGLLALHFSGARQRAGMGLWVYHVFRDYGALGKRCGGGQFHC